MRKIVLLFILIAALSFAHAACAQTSASNVETLQRLFVKIAVRTDSIIARAGAQMLTLEHRSLETQSPERMLYTSLVETFTQKSRRVYTQSDTNRQNIAGVAVQFKIVACEVHYRKLSKPGWFRRAPVQRKTKIAVDLDLRDVQSSQSHFQGVLEAGRVDTLNVSTEQLEVPALSFTAGVWQANENGRSWLEPALLTVATGAIVYAFYSLRSQ
ncbi:hypothetical protein HUU05_09700 [candidate division KSB1 bacterium]|nr:hypothetical protein [candidate division KSB1 bacterium]